MDENEKKQLGLIENPFRDYANNVYFDPTAWDLSVSFGQLGSRLPEAESPKMEWKSTVTMPWPQAKLTAYYFFANLMFHQYENGFITLPPGLVPKILVAPDDASEELKSGYAALREIHSMMFDRETVGAQPR